MPDDTATPAPPPTAPSSAANPAVLALLPEWARSAVVLAPLVLGAGGLGGAGGAFGATQLTTDQAVLAAKVERVQEDVEKLDAKVERVLEIVLKGDR